jgi:CheY-like chemotaxis protein
MDYVTSTKLSVRTLIFSSDVQFLDATSEVLGRLQIAPQAAARCDTALALLQKQKFDVAVVDWQEREKLTDFLCALRRSNRDCVFIAVIRELAELREAFAAGAQLLIHKPASPPQIERCLRAAYQMTVCRRRKQHREPVRIAATVKTSGYEKRPALIVNLSETGAGMSISPVDEAGGTLFRAGDEVEIEFVLPTTDRKLRTLASMIWTSSTRCGLRFEKIPGLELQVLQQWLTSCVERSLAEAGRIVPAMEYGSYELESLPVLAPEPAQVACPPITDGSLGSPQA